MPLATSNKTALKIIANKRQFKRVSVSLNGAICPRTQTVEFVQTLNVSEGGLCIHYDGTIPITPGNELMVQIDGILSSGPQRDLDIYKTSVVYIAGHTIGLKFIGPASKVRI